MEQQTVEYRGNLVSPKMKRILLEAEGRTELEKLDAWAKEIAESEATDNRKWTGRWYDA